MDTADHKEQENLSWSGQFLNKLGLSTWLIDETVRNFVAVTLAVLLAVNVSLFLEVSTYLSGRPCPGIPNNIAF